MKLIQKHIAIWPILAIVLFTLTSVGLTLEYKVKLAYLDKITSFVEWPSSKSDKSVFTITLFGENPFGKEIIKFSEDKEIKGKPVKFVIATKIEQLEEPDIIFIPKSSKSEIGNILNKLSGKATLVISESSGGAKKGTMINFYQSGDKIKFEINPDAANNEGIKISSRLLKLAKVVSAE